MSSIVQEMLDNFKALVNNPASGDNFLPVFIHSSGYDPYLGPDKTGFDWSVDMTDPNFQQIAATICSDLAVNGAICTGEAEVGIADAGDPPILELSGCQILGMSNASILTATASGPPESSQIHLVIQFETYPTKPDNSSITWDWPTQTSLTGNFKLTQHCCCADMSNPNTCKVGSSSVQVGEGTFTTLVNPPAGTFGTGTFDCVVAKLQPNVLELQVNSVSFDIPKNASGAPAITTTVDITSIPEKANPDSYNKLAEEAFNSTDAQTQIINQINAAMNEASALATFSSALTKWLDIYLQNNHQYPFDNPAQALV